MIVRPLAADDRVGWEPLWQGYLQFYETRIAPEVSDLTFARLTGGRDPMGAVNHGSRRGHHNRWPGSSGRDQLGDGPRP